ncbi:hypothetical protein QFC21_007267 [Naganishia friedmannii]|uniref:Uncharacterized protein n=1 Tax=Naganishia friedmannii TaxID=89922 RepID=A0ACC2UX30_9TREE|nr:hypothetical protein QFC21_007267 [Naganishia friedmannii]
MGDNMDREAEDQQSEEMREEEELEDGEQRQNTAPPSQPQVHPGRQRVDTALAAVRRQLVRMPAGSKITLQISRRPDGTYQAIQDSVHEVGGFRMALRERLIRTDPDDGGGWFTRWFDIVARRLSEESDLMLCGEQISLAIVRQSFDRYEWSTDAPRIGSEVGGGRLGL